MSTKKKNVIRVLDMRNAFYEEGDPRRRLEHLDGRLVSSDKKAFANLYPKGYQTYFPGSLGDRKRREEY